jgi:hypothetical protein
MKRPMWTQLSFAWVVAVSLLLAATGAMKLAVLYARFKVSPLARLQPDNSKAVILLILSMVLVIAALVVPLVIRRRAQVWLETTAPKPEKLRP